MAGPHYFRWAEDSTPEFGGGLERTGEHAARGTTGWTKFFGPAATQAMRRTVRDGYFLPILENRMSRGARPRIQPELSSHAPKTPSGPQLIRISLEPSDASNLGTRSDMGRDLSQRNITCREQEYGSGKAKALVEVFGTSFQGLAPKTFLG